MTTIETKIVDGPRAGQTSTCDEMYMDCQVEDDEFVWPKMRGADTPLSDIFLPLGAGDKYIRYKMVDGAYYFHKEAKTLEELNSPNNQ